MHRRPLGRGRILAAIAALVILVGCALPWYTVGGEVEGIPARSVNAFDDLAGLAVFLAALAILALVALPYAAGDQPVGIDRWPSYLILLLAAVAGIAVSVLQIVTGDLLIDGLRPDRAAGLWIAIVGLIVLARATFEIAQERPPR
jgi:hypothetical protein